MFNKLKLGSIFYIIVILLSNNYSFAKNNKSDWDKKKQKINYVHPDDFYTLKSPDLNWKLDGNDSDKVKMVNSENGTILEILVFNQENNDFPFKTARKYIRKYFNYNSNGIVLAVNKNTIRNLPVLEYLVGIERIDDNSIQSNHILCFNHNSTTFLVSYKKSVSPSTYLKSELKDLMKRHLVFSK